jgi:glutathione S-transferase
LLEASPKGTVPVLVLPDQVIEESMQIMMWALQKNDPQSWLPTQPEVQQRALQIVEQCDGAFKFNLDRYKYPNRYDIVDGLSHRDAACEFLIQLDAQLQQYRFLIDDQWRWLDAAVAPFVRQFAKTDREWFKQQSWNALKQWLVDFESSDRLARVMASYKPWHMGQRQVVFAG